MIYIFLAEGCEEVEALSPLDVLKRAKLDVMTACVTGDIITSSHGVKIVADTTIDKISKEDIDAIILPGGMPGTLNLYQSERVKELVAYCMESNKPLCAICAAPLILGRMGYLNGKNAICYPGFEDELKGAKICEDSICKDGNIITAKGVGVALEFGLKIVEELKGKAEALRIKQEIMMK